MAIEQNKIPQMRVQRMGKRYRVVYNETRTLAKFGDGRPVDDGGFEDLYEEGKQVQDGMILAMKSLGAAIAGQPMSDPEEEKYEGERTEDGTT